MIQSKSSELFCKLSDFVLEMYQKATSHHDRNKPEFDVDIA
jgi:hypothetical protein